MSLSTKSIGNVESRLHRQDLRYCKSAQGRKYFNDKFSCMESKIHSKNTDMKVFIATSYDALIVKFFTALWRGFSDDSGTAITTWRKQSFIMEHVEPQCANIYVRRSHGCCAWISMAASERLSYWKIIESIYIIEKNYRKYIAITLFLSACRKQRVWTRYMVQGSVSEDI